MPRSSSFAKRSRSRGTQPSAPETSRSRRLRLIPPLILLLVAASLIVPHVLVGGVKLVFSIPGYLLIGGAALLTALVSFRRVQVGARLVPVISAIALAVYVIGRSYASPVEYLARADRFMVLGALLVYLLTAFYLTTPKQRIAVLALLLIVAAVDVACGFIQFFQANNFMLLSLVHESSPIPPIFRPDYGERASGFLGSPNHLAGFLETLGLIALSLTCLGRWNAAARLVFGTGAAIAFVGVAFTGSRGGYLSTAAGITAFLILLSWIARKLRPKRFLLIVMIAIIASTAVITAAIMLMSSNVLLSNRMGNVIDTTDMRGHLWTAAIEQFRLAPVLGTGSGTYLYFGRQFRDESVQADPIFAHNDYLHLLAEYGIAGVALAGLFLIFHLHSGWKGIGRISRKRLRPAKRIFSTEMALMAGGLAAVVALLAHSVVDFNAHIPSNTLFFAFIFGILASPSCDPQISGRKPASGPRFARFIFPAIGALLVALTAPLLAGEYFAEWARVQLRCMDYISVSADLSRKMTRALPAAASGIVFPTDQIDQRWPHSVNELHFIPRALDFAEKGLRHEEDNPDLHYYLGQARHFQSLYASGERRRELQMAAVAAFEKAYRLFPMDVRVLLRLARAFDNLGLPQNAEFYLAKAIAADPKLGSVFAQYGIHLWQQRKLARAEAYYRKALSLDWENEIALAGIRDIERLRALSADEAHVEIYGDPLEDFDLEPPDDEDARRGVLVE